MPNPDDMTVIELLERANKVNNNSRINESPVFWINQAIERLEKREA